jgi:O-antigen/teichoic acid export membrane protein
MGIGRNTIIGLAVDLTVFALGIIVSIVLTRSLGPEQRGVYVLLFTTNLLIANLANLSISGAFSTMLARGRYLLGELNVVAVLMALATGIVSLLIVIIAYPFLMDNVFNNVPFEYLLVALALVPTAIYQIYWTHMMMGTDHVLLMNKVSLALNLVNGILIIVVVGVLGLGIPGALVVWVLTGVGGFVTMAVLAARMDLYTRPRGKTLRDVLGFGLRSHGAQVAHHLYLRFDMYAVNVFVGSSGVGFYSLSTSLAEKLWLPLNAIYASSMGKIAQLPREESALLTAKVVRAALMLMMALALPFALVSPWLIPFLYGPEFSASVLPLVILLGGTLGFAVMMVLNTYILGQMERPGLLSIIGWLQLGVSIPLYIGLIMLWGIVGAAFASTLTYLIAMTSTLIVFKRDSGLSIGTILVPRASDFADYSRVIKPILGRVPALKRFADKPS